MTSLFDLSGRRGWDACRIPVVKFPKARSKPMPQPRSRRGAIAAVAVTLGLAAGAFALYWWRRTKQREADAQPKAQTSLEQPATAVVWLPRTPDEYDDLLVTARAFVNMTPDVDQLQRLVWAWHWRQPYPRAHDPGNHSSVGQAIVLLRAIVETVWAERSAAQAQPPRSAVDAQPEPAPAPEVFPTRAPEPETASTPMPEPEAIPTPMPKPEPAPPPPSEPGLSTLVCEAPTAGYFYRVREGDELVGDEGIAARALYMAALEAAVRKGWQPNRAQTRARKFAGKARAQAAYVEVIGRSEWNAGALETLAEGALLWLPPLRSFSLLDRSRQRQVAVDTHPWPDGSSKLEPPPELRELGPRHGSLWVVA